MDRTAADAIEIVTTGPRLAEVVEAASRQKRVAVDLESNGFHRYPERVCLVQLATPDSVWLIDPLVIQDVAPLGDLLADERVEKIMHSADYDVRSLDREWGFRIRNLFDTSIAAAFVGSTRLGLAAILQDYLGVEVTKSKKLQRSDWTIRPVRPDARRYAADDVIYLESIRDLLAQRLSDKSRLDWVAEECERLASVRYRPPDKEWGFLSIKGSRILDDQGLTVLRSLHRFREDEAIKRDRPPFKVLNDSALLTLAGDPGAELAGVKGLGRFGHPPDSKGLRAALQAGLSERPIRRPRTTVYGRRRTQSERAAALDRLVKLKGWRTGLGKKLGLDPALLWPVVSLTRIADAPDEFAGELTSREVRSWQSREFGSALQSVIESRM